VVYCAVGLQTVARKQHDTLFNNGCYPGSGVATTHSDLWRMTHPRWLRRTKTLQNVLQQRHSWHCGPVRAISGWWC